MKVVRVSAQIGRKEVKFFFNPYSRVDDDGVALTSKGMALQKVVLLETNTKQVDGKASKPSMCNVTTLQSDFVDNL